MSATPKPTGFFDRPIMNPNTVHASIKSIADAKRAGAFTFQAGRADKFINLGMGLGVLFLMGNVGMGVHKLANGYGKKDGF